ncbi:hypothetical protein NLG97_g2649 [Lecanicillium saksenae]|uniref:Uncharacterized protein n=1 Tax=Lecanicillium saksenae TaxID=468837 RepID=A0ACC1R0B0_9HYPO|nr:hypothetical protein NLG97_g2649 [Lecanicillium saksenae]
MFGVLNGTEIQTIVPSTRDMYTAWVEKKSRNYDDPPIPNRLFHDVQPLETGRDSAILWLGDRYRAKKVVLFLHGGGGVIPACAGHANWAWNAYVMAGAEAGIEVAVAFLQYTLAPRGQLPIPLLQAIAALNLVLAQGFQPQDIIVGGDSVGGNLTMQLLGHLLHPQPAVPSIKITGPLQAAFLVSPALGSSMSYKSFEDNFQCDMICGPIVQKLVLQSLPRHLHGTLDSSPIPWAQPLQAPPGFFGGMDSVVRQIYISYGEFEVLADHSRVMAGIIRKEAPGLVLRVDEGAREPHDGILLENFIMRPGRATEVMKAWFLSVIYT